MGKKKTKTEMISDVVELLDKIEKARDEVTAARIRVDDKKEEVATAKGVWKAAIDRMMELIDTRRRWAEVAALQELLQESSRQLVAYHREAVKFKDKLETSRSEVGVLERLVEALQAKLAEFKPRDLDAMVEAVADGLVQAGYPIAAEAIRDPERYLNKVVRKKLSAFAAPPEPKPIDPTPAREEFAKWLKASNAPEYRLIGYDLGYPANYVSAAFNAAVALLNPAGKSDVEP